MTLRPKLLKDRNRASDLFRKERFWRVREHNAERPSGPIGPSGGLCCKVQRLREGSA